jgi:hypothetical protein
MWISPRSAPHARVVVHDAQQDRPERCARHRADDATGWHRAVHVKNIEMQKMRTLLANRKQWRKAGYVLT